MNINATRIYRDYILKARRRRFIQYSLCLIVLAVAGVPIIAQAIYSVITGFAETATVISMTDKAFTVGYYVNTSPYRAYTTIMSSEYPFPVFMNQNLVVYSGNEGIRTDIIGPVISAILLAGAVYYFLKALYFMYLKAVNMKNVEKLMTEGKLLTCEIDRIEKKPSIFRDFRIILRHTDIYGKTHYFQTERYYFDPFVYLDGVTSMKVYVDPMNYKLYHIETPDGFPAEPWHYYY